MNRFSVRVSGRTAYEKAFDSEWEGNLCVFGETILFWEAASYKGALVLGRRRRTTDAVWHHGLWLCRAEKQTNIFLTLGLEFSSRETLEFSSRETFVKSWLNSVVQRTWL